MKKMSREEYVKQGGIVCPWCESGDLEGDSIDIDTGIAWQDIRCENCSAVWRDDYKLVSYEERYSPAEGMLEKVCGVLESLLDGWLKSSNESNQKCLLVVDRSVVRNAGEILAICKKIGAY